MTIILLPESVKQIHKMIIKTTGGEMGGFSEGKIQICLEYPFHEFHRYKKFRNIFQQAGALLYAFATFHAFTDGNKRTGLIVTQLFLTLNGHDFSYPDDTFDYVIAIASNKIRSNRRISKWLKENSIKSKDYRDDGRYLTFTDARSVDIITQLGGRLRVKVI